ncbi:MAG: histidine kinase, partial [Bradyrhizobium sp.]|nr:histidine kinase [Bradyrhizobium sp.]
MFKRKSNSDALALMATKVVSANLMVADNDLNIVYMNNAVTDLLRTAEADLKKELPHFNVNTLVGTNIDVFHKNPQHQRQMLASLSTVHRAMI